MTYAIKAEVADPAAKTFEFRDQKTMYGGKAIAAGDTIFIFASENEGGRGLVARGVVVSSRATPRKPPRDRAQLQVLSPGDGQDRRHFGCGGRVPRAILLAPSSETKSPSRGGALPDRSGGRYTNCLFNSS